ncbi:hypothetical protein B0F90DRAFT_1807893 [Multifurca ochricompacta]|uniref:UBC core domain-containing protein n=1 Tax=Multifurca ochricompacta TaxID=376703 RepID=A0AAD4QT02_9AGAM|nr:hypothetical protein B0F90DRAFT_1807893 [Multifurca ochricompacta]
MENEIQQLVDMGATVNQARAALRRYNDVMEAAERIFDGAFDDIPDESSDTPIASAGQQPRGLWYTFFHTPEEEDNTYEEAAGSGEDDNEDDEFVNYDSDYEIRDDTPNAQVDIDPYAGIFFSKDRREEVIEVEEEPETVHISGISERVKLMTQNQWMKGCPEGGEQGFLFSLYSQLIEGNCPCPSACGYSIPRAKSHFFAVFPSFEVYINQLRGIVRQKCKRCFKEFCFACGEPINGPKIPELATVSNDHDLFHCSNLQGIILGVGLAMLEQLYHDQLQNPLGHENKIRTSKRRKTDPVINTSMILDPDDDDDSYISSSALGKKLKVGIGYAGDQKEDTTGQAEAQAMQQSKDEKLGKLMTQLRVFLPSLRRPGGALTSDYLVHPTALAHLRRRFNNICSSLLRNDSLTDMSDRSSVYFELFEWLETISNHEALASMMAMPIMVVSSVRTHTPKKAANGTLPLRERTIIYEGSTGPRELLESIVIQANAAIKGLEGIKPTEIVPVEMTEEQKRVNNDTKGKAKEISMPSLSEENQKLLGFCQRILTTADAIDRSLRETKGERFLERIQESLPKIHTANSTSNEVFVDVEASDEAIRQLYIDWATRVRFEYCDLTVSPPADKPVTQDEPPNYKFYYNTEARMLASSDIPKRSLAIAKELAVLTTNLPVAWDSSIFLRVDETRVDIIKALIIGPEGTPFLFDIFLGHNYNQLPPSVKYMTTNGGKFRFNPNLYADGKVCLSLLGTWAGPGWVAGKSTLLQVLISIQSMILCEEPYLNEPGWASSSGTPQSMAYSANIRRMVVKTAMLGNLKNPPEPFGDIIRTHFRLKAQSISAQLDQWLSQDDGSPTVNDGATSGRGSQGGSANGLQTDIEELKRVMKQLQDASISISTSTSSSH